MAVLISLSSPAVSSIFAARDFSSAAQACASRAYWHIQVFAKQPGQCDLAGWRPSGSDLPKQLDHQPGCLDASGAKARITAPEYPCLSNSCFLSTLPSG